MIRFYAPDIEVTGVLPEQESAHCCKVLRMKAGDRISVVDGKGGVYECEICNPHRNRTSVEILSKSIEELHWQPNITLAVAPTKNMERMEWLVEKCVEIGVNRLVFVDCHNSVRKSVKRERLEKILISAMKQSLKATLPEFVEIMPVKELILNGNSTARYVGYCDSNYPRIKFATDYNGRDDITILIGPEGDFTPEEIKMAVDAGFKPVTFGATRLRTETAALYALCATHTDMELGVGN
ncbi:MAG: 16S rRNA (uracil(1498)-N(3))-methyltransferase [Candidatus Amulumruptor caecigallinarius]|nr:16S rRNA (uracil(1498)-N(3))-methyltransferase [Candidatus Amulumruptor caecigallinarius]